MRVESPPDSIDSPSPCCILMQVALPNAVVQQPVGGQGGGGRVEKKIFKNALD